MTSARERKILVREPDGSVHPFLAAELQSRLVGGFLGAGLRDSVDIAEDIALAVEYTLLNTPRSEAVFGRGELDAAVIRLLEEAGFPEVAGIFGRGEAPRADWIAPERAALLELLRAHLAASPERLDRIADRVLEATEKLALESCSPHLLLELARHCERTLEAENTARSARAAAAVNDLRPALSRREIEALLAPEEQVLLDDGILRINGVTALFPCAHFFFLMHPFARREKFGIPATELEIEPALYRAGSVLNEIKRKLDRESGRGEPLPCILSIPDMYDFLSVYTGKAAGADPLAAEFGGALASAFDGGVYKLSFS